MNAITPLTVAGVAMRASDGAEQVESAGALEHADEQAHTAHHHDDGPRDMPEHRRVVTGANQHEDGSGGERGETEVHLQEHDGGHPRSADRQCRPVMPATAA